MTNPGLCLFLPPDLLLIFSSSLDFLITRSLHQSLSLSFHWPSSPSGGGVSQAPLSKQEQMLAAKGAEGSLLPCFTSCSSSCSCFLSTAAAFFPVFASREGNNIIPFILEEGFIIFSGFFVFIVSFNWRDLRDHLLQPLREGCPLVCLALASVSFVIIMK